MSTISSTSVAASAHAFSPKQRILDSIASQVQTGAISAADQTALDSAVASIDDSLKSGGTSTGGTSGRTRLDPSEMKSRIDDLISSQVSSGTLTSDQAETLKQIFSEGPSRGGGPGGGSGGPGGIGGAGGPPSGPPPGPPPSDDASGDTSTSSGSTTASTDGTTASDTASSDDVSALLASFIKQLQDVQGRLGYSASGQSGGSRTASAMLVNFEA